MPTLAGIVQNVKAMFSKASPPSEHDGFDFTYDVSREEAYNLMEVGGVARVTPIFYPLFLFCRRS